MEHAIAIWTESSQGHSDLWMFYIVIVTAVVGYAFSESFERSTKSNPTVGYALLLALFAFMVANVYSIWRNLDMYESATKAIALYAKGDTILKTVTSSIVDIDRWLVIPLHLVLDLLVIYVVYSRIRR